MDSSIVPAKGDLMDLISSGKGLPVVSKIFSSCAEHQGIDGNI